MMLRKGPNLETMTISQRSGIRYERRVAKTLVAQGYDILAGQWFGYKFLGESNHNFCQPDILILGPDRIVIIECKLTQRAEAIKQLQLYSQVLATCDSLCNSHHIVTAQVYHNAKFEVPVAFTFDCLFDGTKTDYNIHWR